jgi:hypothetical protein
LHGAALEAKLTLASEGRGPPGSGELSGRLAPPPRLATPVPAESGFASVADSDSARRA